MNLNDIIDKLIGPVAACGEHSIDLKRHKNLLELIELTEHLVQKLENAAITKDRQEASMRKIGQEASEYLKQLRSKE